MAGKDTLTCRKHTPLGLLTLTASAQGLVRIKLHAVSNALQAGTDFLHAVPDAAGVDRQPEAAQALDAACRWMDAYLAHRPLPPLPRLDLAGSGFQLRVWRELLAVSYGQTVTYGELARRIGQPGAVRAIGGAVHRNPLPFIVPCHRVVAAQGLGGYAYGAELKVFLLRHENCTLPARPAR